MPRRLIPLLLLGLPLLAVLGAAQAQQGPAPAGVILGLDGKPDALPDAAFVETIQKQCSKCHVPPQPQYLPRGMWRLRIQEMAQRSLMGTGVTPGEESVLWQMDTAQFVRYFESRAPVNLPLPEPWPPGDGGLRFAKEAWTPPGEAKVPVVANVRFFDLDGDGKKEIIFTCESAKPSGIGVGYLKLVEGKWTAHDISGGQGVKFDLAEVFDVDGDGDLDIIACEESANLGVFWYENPFKK